MIITNTLPKVCINRYMNIEVRTLLILIYYPHLLLSIDILLERQSVFCRYLTLRCFKHYLEKKENHLEDVSKEESYMPTPYKYIRNLGSSNIIIVDLWGLSSMLEVAWENGIRKLILKRDSNARL